MSLKTTLLKLPAERPRLSRLIFFLLGCLATTTFAPLGWYLLLPFLLLPFLYACLTLAPAEAARHGFWLGIGWFLTGTYWIYISVVVFGQAPPWIALLLMFGLVLIMSAYLALTAWVISRTSAGEPWLLLIVAPAAWVLIEWLRGWLLSGFPWLALGYSQIDSPLAGWAPLAGVYGVSLLLMLSVAALLTAVKVREWQRWLAVGIAIMPWLAGELLSSLEWTRVSAMPVTVTLLQGGVSQDRKWLPAQLQPTLDYYRNETRRSGKSAIVVWPEVAIPAVNDRVENYLELLEADSRNNGQTIVFGILERVYEPHDEAKIYNSVFAFDGVRRQAYRKRHLVPFGEYFPVPAAVREWMRMLNLPHSDLAAGAAEQPLLTTYNGLRLAVAICYEDAYGAEQLYALPDANLLVNVSNDAWFGDSIAPHQHLQIARMRSLEVGRPTVRATNTGISAFIGPDGRIIDSGPQFQPVSLSATLEPRSGSTPYARTGNWPVVAYCAVLIALFLVRARAPR